MFTATHCGQTYTGEEGARELKAHMQGAHGRRTFPNAPRVSKPRPWRAPGPTKGGMAAVLERAAAGHYDKVSAHGLGRHTRSGAVEFTDLDDLTTTEEAA